MPTFNEDQLRAIHARNQNLLVSAAAGSGKTTVMIRKIVEELTTTEKTLDQYLVITFTRDAADHMYRKLEEELIRAAGSADGRTAERARHALQALDGAAISTIHTFCLRTIREHFDAAGVSPEVRAIDEDLPDQLFAQAYIDAVEELFSPEGGASGEEREAVRILFRALRQEEAQAAVRKLHDTLMGIPEPFERLDGLLEHPWEAWAQEVREAVRLDLTEAEELAERERALLADPLLPQACVPVLEEDLAALETLRPEEATAESLLALKERFASLRVTRCPPESREVYEAVKELRKRLKGAQSLFEKAAKELRALEDPEQAALHARILQELRGLRVLLRATDEKYREAKQERAAVDFADMEQLTYGLLRDENIRRELLERYTEIYVDETQDISAIQDAIIQSFRAEGHTLFMVGDIKQSIYRFRHAEPELFDRKRRAFSDAEEADTRRIFFRDNYRSCRAVIDCVNAVFAECMAEEVTELAYAPEDALRANREGEFGPVEVRLVSRDGEGAEAPEPAGEAEEAGEEAEAADLLEAQCREAAEIMLGLVREGAHFRDMAILLRSARNDAPRMVDCFRRLHVPVCYDGPSSFFGLPEIAFFLDLLTVIENEQTDVELYGALKNLPFSFSDGELADIRLEKRDGAFWEAFRFCADRGEKLIDQRCRAVRERLSAWRQEARETTAADFIWRLMRETGFYASRGAYPDGALRQANLDALYQKALDLAARGAVRLPDFLSEVRRIQITDRKSEDAPSALSPGEDVARIMTMHGSKGLEFPIVLLMNLHKSLRVRRAEGPLRVELGGRRPLGLYLPMIDRPAHLRRETYGRRAFEARSIRNAIAEDTRLLYVAMTRAENRLFLLGAAGKKDWERWRSPSRLHRIWSTRSMLDMLMPTVLARTGQPEAGETRRAGDWTLSLRAPGRVGEMEEKRADRFEALLREVLAQAPDAPPEGLWTPEARRRAPLKTSVTTLVRTMEDQLPEEEETVETKRQPETVISTFRLGELPRRPAFLEEEKPAPAEIGTAAHRFLRLIDLERLRGETDPEGELRAQLDSLLREKIMSREEAGRIRLAQTAAFLRSPLGQRLIAAEGVYREWPFTLRLSPDQPTLVQGIIDAAFREADGWVLLDYKTDRDTRQETFVPRHALQMNWYRTAVERITGERVKEMWLVALRDTRVYPVMPVDVSELVRTIQPAY